MKIFSKKTLALFLSIIMLIGTFSNLGLAVDTGNRIVPTETINEEVKPVKEEEKDTDKKPAEETEEEKAEEPVQEKNEKPEEINIESNNEISGEEDSEVVEISTADQLIDLANKSQSAQETEWAKTYQLANDIDMEEATPGQKMKPIGNSSHPFTGVFDGDGHAIKNFEISFSSENGGLFYKLSSSATVKNLKLVDGDFSLYGSSGALAGTNEGTIENCSSVNTQITCTSSVVGGLVGINEGTVERSFVDSGVVKYDNTYNTTTHGGLVGRNTPDGTINECYSSATVEAKKWCGGLVGWNYGSIINSYSTGTVKGTEEIGGFIGRAADSSNIENCYANTDVVPETSGGAFIGGLSSGGGTASNCFYNSERQLPSENSATLDGIEAKTAEELKSDEVLAALNNGNSIWGKADNINGGFPYILSIAPESSGPEPSGEITVEVLVATYDFENYSFETHIGVTPIKVEKEGTSPTVLDVLEAGEEEIPYEAEDGDYGKFIKSIDGIEAVFPDGWMFTVNDKVSPVGVSTATVKDGDKILWYYGSPVNNFKGPKWDEMVSPTPGEGEESGYFEGEGTEENPYLVEKAKDFSHIMEYPEAHFKLNNDINLKDAEFEPIGTESNPFRGTFDGNNKEISNLKIDKLESSKNIGLFGVLDNAKIVNVTITNANVTGGSRLGILAGYAKEDGEGGFCLIGNCHVSGRITALGTDVIKATRTGGLIGINDGNNTVPGTGSGSYIYSIIDNCSADAEVICSTVPIGDGGDVGGLVGWNRGIIRNSYAEGNVNGGNLVGGLVGSNWEQIYNSHAMGNVTGCQTVGGFAGSNNLYTTIENCYSTGNVIGDKINKGNFVGGFVGSTSGKTKNSVSTGTVVPSWSWNGGFAGYYDGYDVENDLQNCFGNSTDYLGNIIKGLGSDTEGKYGEIGVTPEEAREKLQEILGVTLPEEDDNDDKLSVRREAEKYEDSVLIPNTAAEGSNVTSYIVRLKDGQTSDPTIYLVYAQKNYTGYVSDSVTPGQYTLLKQKTTEGNEETSVTLGFIKNGEFFTKDISVTIESTVPISKETLSAKVNEIESKIEDGTLKESDYTEKSWRALQEALNIAKEVLEKENPSQQEIVEALTRLVSSLEGLEEEETEDERTIRETVETLRNYYGEKSEYTFRVAIGYNYTSDNLERDIPIIRDRYAVSENLNGATAYAGNIIGLISAGRNPYDYNGKNYIKELADSQQDSGKFIVGTSDDYPTALAFGIIALDMAKGEYDVEKAVSALIGYQNNDGSFGSYGMVDDAAMSIMALGSHRDLNGVNNSINRALAYLRANQKNSGGFETFGSENPYSVSAVIQGLIAVGEDPLSSEWRKNGNSMLDALISYKVGDHFESTSEWGTEIDSATEQAFIALADLYRGKSMFKEIGLEEGEPATVRILEPAKTVLKENETLNLEARTYDENNNYLPAYDLLWESSDNNVAEVDKDGTVTAKKAGKVTITVKIKGYENIADTVGLTVEPEDFQIERIGNDPIRKGTEGRVEIRIKNISSSDKSATFIVVLFNKDESKMINYSYVNEAIKAGETKEMGAGFLIPETGDYIIKAIVWDNFENQNILLGIPLRIEVE